MSEASYDVEVLARDLARALDTAATGLPSRRRFDFRFSWDGDGLSVLGPGASMTITAEGNWAGSVLVDGRPLSRLVPFLERDGAIHISAQAGRLKIGPTVFPAHVMDIAPAGIDFAIGPTDLDVLLAIERHGEVSVVASVGLQAVETARRSLDVACSNAASALKNFSISKQEIAELAMACIRRRAK